MNAFPADTRGERNNNPGNLRFSPQILWNGLDDPRQDDGGYCRFRTAVMGIRALARDLLSNGRRGLDTVHKIVAIYAPPTENDTAAYIADVCQRLAVGADDPLAFDGATVAALVRAIIFHENGRCIYDAATVGQAVSMAFVP